jgi:predicted RNase H-like nuclease (RuvC/YqgF family)
MTDKMTDNEIITALEHCSASMDCDSCNFGISENCVGDLLKVSLDLIIRLKEANKHHEKAEEFAEKAFKAHEEETNRKDKEIEILIRKKESLKDEIAEKDAEIERLKNAYKDGVKRALLEVGDGLAHYGKCDELYLYEVTDVLCRVEDELTGKYDDMFTKNRNKERKEKSNGLDRK